MQTNPNQSPRPLAGNPGAKRSTNSTPLPAPELIAESSAAVIVGMGRRTLWALTRCRAIPHRKIGRSVRYVPRELNAWIDAGCPTEPDAMDRVLRDLRRGGGR
ncbi:MAG: helix-turn-helix domain-containing protein [Phycisphaerales bacterium]